jgi:hypothetical protein
MTHRGPSRSFSYAQLVVGVIVGTPIALFAMVFVNARCGERSSAAVALAFATTAFIALAFFGPQGVLAGLAGYLSAAVCGLWLNHVFMHKAGGSQSAGWGKALLFSLAGLATFLTLAFSFDI